MRCNTCGDHANLGDGPIYFVEQVSEGAYAHRCRRGHWLKMILTNPRHEVLFESGAIALLFGFNREALTSFHVALERFYLFATKVMLRYAEIDDAHVAETLKNHVNKASEREFGAFVFIYLMTFKRPFAFHKEIKTVIERRNRVVHGGEIPTHADVMAHGQAIYTIVRTINEDLASLFHPAEVSRMFQWEEPVGAQAAIEKVTNEPYKGPLMNQRMILSYWKMYRSITWPTDDIRQDDSSVVLLPDRGPPVLGAPPSMDLPDALEELRRGMIRMGGVPEMDLSQH
jgi:hypothetical protein